MKRNGYPKKTELHTGLQFERQARASAVHTRIAFLLWLRRWNRHPGRIWWLIGPTGERKLL